MARAGEDYEAAQVEARRITVDTTRIASEAFPMAVPPEEAERRCLRALMEAWTSRENAVCGGFKMALLERLSFAAGHPSRLPDHCSHDSAG